jgi:hypothetical protein
MHSRGTLGLSTHLSKLAHNRKLTRGNRSSSGLANLSPCKTVGQALASLFVLIAAPNPQPSPCHFLIAAPFRGINKVPGGVILFTCEKFL